MSSSRSGRILHGAVPLLGRQRRHRREQIALRFLAAEAAAHAPHIDRHRRMLVNAQHMRHHHLHFASDAGSRSTPSRPRPRPGSPARSGLRDRNAPARRSAMLPLTRCCAPRQAPPSTSPRSSFSGSVTSLPPAACAASHIERRRQVAVFDLAPAAPPAAPPRASPRSPRTSAGPRNAPCPRRTPARHACATGLTSFSPGISSAVSTPTTPGAALHRIEIDRNDLGMRPARQPQIGMQRALGLDQSSIYSARPATCLVR